MASNAISWTAQALEVNPLGINKILGFRGKFTVPISQVRRISLGYGLLDGGAVLRILGTSLPSKNVGIFGKNHLKAYVNVGKNEVPIVIELAGESVDQLILGVENSQEVLELLKRDFPHLFVDLPEVGALPERQMSPRAKLVNGLVRAMIVLIIPASLLGLIVGAIDERMPVMARILVPITLVLTGLVILLAILAIIFTVKDQKQNS